MATAKSNPPSQYTDITMATAKGYTLANDITMETARGNTGTIRRGFQGWERELLDSPEIRRKATVAQLCK